MGSSKVETDYISDKLAGKLPQVQRAHRETNIHGMRFTRFESVDVTFEEYSSMYFKVRYKIKTKRKKQ